MAKYTKIVTITSDAYPGPAQVVLPWKPKSILIMNETAGSIFKYIFEDPAAVTPTNKEVKSTPGTPSSAITFFGGEQSIWFKKNTAGVTNGDVQVIAESDD